MMNFLTPFCLLQYLWSSYPPRETSFSTRPVIIPMSKDPEVAKGTLTELNKLIDNMN
jgi:hypothetical protein